MDEYLCPHCGMNIYDDEALLCHFCGESLGRPSKGMLGRMRYSHPKILWVFVLFFVLIAFILLVTFF